MDKAELIKLLKEKGIKLQINDGSCGCCGNTSLKIEIEGKVYEADAGDRTNQDGTNINTEEN